MPSCTVLSIFRCRVSIAHKLEKRSESGQVLGTILSALPVPGVGASYMSYQDAKDATKEQRTKNFLSGFIPGTLGGAGAMLGSGLLANKLKHRLAATGKIHPKLLAAMPYLVGAGAGMVVEPITTNLGLRAYHRANSLD